MAIFGHFLAIFFFVVFLKDLLGCRVFFFMEYWNIIKPARNFSEKVTFSRTIFFLDDHQIVCLFVFVNALKSYTVLLLHCFYTVDRYNQNCCTNFFLWIFLSMQINSFFFTIYWFFFFVEIVEKLEQSSSWSFFTAKKHILALFLNIWLYS